MFTWLRHYRYDIARYQAIRPNDPMLYIIMTEQGLWALFFYRLGAAIQRWRVPFAVKLPFLALTVVWGKLMEVLTGISLPSRATVGPGLYIAHFGPTLIHHDAVIGSDCTIMQGVTIGMSGRGDKRGVPTIGNRVYLGVNAVIVGNIAIGDDALVSPCSLVSRDVAPHTTVMGVPATVVNSHGSGGYIMPNLMPVYHEREAFSYAAS